MPEPLLTTLRELAVLGRPPDASASGTARFVAQLCEAGSPLRLLPPYGALLRSWIASDGSVAVSADGHCLDETLWRNLAALPYWDELSRSACMAASEAVLHALSRNGVGAPLASGAAGDVCVPTTVEEVAAMPAVQTTLRLLDAEAALSGSSESHSSQELRTVLSTQLGSLARAHFMDSAGLIILHWVRKVEAHRFFEAAALPRSGLSGAVIMEAVQAALETFSAGPWADYELDDEGILCRIPGYRKQW
jgi:hypothetical protein